MNGGGGAVIGPERVLGRLHRRDIGRAKRHVVSGAGARNAGHVAGGVADIDGIGLGDETLDAALTRPQPVAEAGEEARGFLGRIGEEGYRAQRADALRARLGQVAADQLDDDAVGILEAQHGLAHFARWPFDRHAMGERAGEPIAHGGGGNGEGDLGDLAGADAARGPILPGEEGDEAAGGPLRIAIEQVKLGVVLEPAGALDEGEAEKADIEIDIGLYVGRDAGDVMDAARHACYPALCGQPATTSA